ncbi:MAG: ATP-binding protein [Xanthomonadales bacterium]|nr:ATP-binding protein [Xanthomonadales bacterium]
MSRLFLKIFVSFWLAITLMVGATVWLNLWVLENYGSTEVPAEVRDRLQDIVERAAASIDQFGIRRMPRGPARRMLHVIDEQGRDLNPRPLPPHLEDIAVLGEPPNRASGPDYSAVTVADPRGRLYRVVGVVRMPPQLLAAGRRGALLRLAVAAVVSALVCWLLAVYLTRPVRRLRWATVGLAEGDLGRRVGGDYARDEIGDLARDFDRMADRLQRSRTAQQQLLRDVSHELRSPLARMQVALELAREKVGALAAGELDRIEEEAERLNQLIGDVMLLSRGLADDAPVKRSSADLAALVKQVVEDAAYEGRPGGKSVRYAGPEALSVEMDRGLIKRAIENVVRNALRFTPDGAEVEVELSSDDALAELVVRDTGPGVPEEELQRIFLPFHRVDRSRSPGGHGIGLAIAAAAVDVHDGAMEARNRKGAGLEVRISLPLER